MKEFLTSLVGVDTVEQQIDIARQKGGIGSREPYTLERFEFSAKKYPAWFVQFICSYVSSEPNRQLHLHKKIFVIK